MGVVVAQLLTQEFLRTVFYFDENRFMLVWKERADRSPQWNGRYAGTDAGCDQTFATSGPYRVINVGGMPRLAHRLIWIYLYGYEPDEIDHEDGDGLYNNPENLRDASSSQNKCNKNDDALGYTKRGNRYRARVKIEGAIFELGNFDTAEEAHLAYLEGTLKHQGEFARINRFIRRI